MARPKRIIEPISTIDPPTQRIIRDAEFAKRLESACDGHPHVPPLHRGRLTWFRDQLQQRFKMSVTTETVRKWFWGEAKPRPDKIAMIAELLGVDVAWLQIGVDPGMPPRERKARNAMADGAVNIVAGLIQMDGGHPAFPDEEGEIDLYAIIRGANYAFHVSLGEPVGAGARFAVPVKRKGLLVLGLLRRDLCFEIIEITEALIEARGTKRGGSIEVPVDGRTLNRLPRIDGFTARL